MTISGRVLNSAWPTFRQTPAVVRGAQAAGYGAFIGATFPSDAAALGISKAEARGFDPMVLLILETSYIVLLDPTNKSDCRA